LLPPLSVVPPQDQESIQEAHLPLCFMFVFHFLDKTLSNSFCAKGETKIMLNISHFIRAEEAIFSRALNYLDTQKKTEKPGDGQGVRKHSVYFA